MPYQLLHECPSKNYLFVELTEYRSLAKVYCIGIKLPLGWKLLVKGVGNKTGPYDYLEHSVPLIMGEFSKVDCGIKKEKWADLRLRDAQPV